MITMDNKFVVAITGDELRRALVELEAAEAAGFVASEAVFNTKIENKWWVVGSFADIAERAHPTDPSLNWGRDNYLVKRGARFENGRLVWRKEPDTRGAL